VPSVATLAVSAAFTAGAAVRGLLLMWNVGVDFERDPLLVEPSASVTCRREVFYLLRHNISTLAATTPACFEQPCVFLLAGWHGWILMGKPDALPEWTAGAAIILVELACARLLLVLRGSVSVAGHCACIVLLLSPWNVVACAAMSTAALPALLMLLAVCMAWKHHQIGSAASLATATIISPDYAWLLPVLARLASDAHAGDAHPALRVVAAYGLWVCVLGLALSALSDDALPWLVAGVQTWLEGGAADRPPNVGMWWYLMVLLDSLPEVRATSVAAMHILPRLSILALAAMMPRGNARGIAPPFLPMALSFAVLVATKIHPVMPEVVLAVAFAGAQLDGCLLARCRMLPAAVIGVFVGALISRPLLSEWIDHRQLNANFFYASAMLFSSAQLLLVYDITAAALSAYA